MKKSTIINLKKLSIIILLVSMLILIYQVSPRITILIKNILNWINNLDETLITRIIEITLIICFGRIIINTNKKEV